MSRVDFYVISSTGEAARQQFACRLVEKAYRMDNKVHIVAGTEQAARQLDELLWTFRDGSFVPHELVGETAAVLPAPITIGIDSAPPREADLLINLSHDFPAAADAYPRIAEIVTADEDSRNLCRQRFVDYRERGHTLDTHKL